MISTYLFAAALALFAEAAPAAKPAETAATPTAATPTAAQAEAAPAAKPKRVCTKKKVVGTMVPRVTCYEVQPKTPEPDEVAERPELSPSL